MDKERFSLLILEPHEIYFEDFSVNLLTKENEGNTYTESCNGRLKMCSKSIVFDPKAHLYPIIKIPYKDCEKIYRWEGNLKTRETNVLAIKCLQYIEMFENNIIKPYDFKIEKRIFLFNMHYVKVDDYLPYLGQLHRASSLNAHEQNNMIATIVYSRQNRVKFDRLWLDDIYEKINEYQVDEINPLVLNPGRLCLSTTSIYFQSYNNIQTYPVIKIKLNTIKNLIKRRFLLRHTGLEIIYNLNDNNNCNNLILYVSFQTSGKREEFLNEIMNINRFLINDLEQESITLKWQNSLISNYDYLLYLNSLADRTFNDLTQYPIFPWILNDYKSDVIDLNDENIYRDLSKPIGALNPLRLIKLMERYDEMADPKFLYGSHYSAPGLVLFYLVRKYPKLMLCLQNGRFDHPDRMFNSIMDTYNNCLNNMSDFKELIPEFYDINNNGDFLQNINNINFGIKCTGEMVNNVLLPKWAKNSEKLFIEIMREALESDHVSKNLNHWIDLIFGYKQRGKDAEEAKNLFYHLCYEGSVNLDHINDLQSKHALEVQISEFGQIPKQLFNVPHIKRIIKSDANDNNDDNNINKISYDINDKRLNLINNNIQLDFTFNLHKNIIQNLLLYNKDNNLISIGKDGLLKCYNIIDNYKQIRSINISNMALSSCIKIPKTEIVVLGSWDNTIIIYNLDYGRTINIIQAHDDAVSCLSYLEDLGVLISGSWDCSLKIWKRINEPVSSSPFRISDSILAYLSLEEKIVCVHSIQDDDLIKIILGTTNGDVILWQLKINPSTLNITEIYDYKLIKNYLVDIINVQFSQNHNNIIICNKNGYIELIDINTKMLLYKNNIKDNIITTMYLSYDNYLLLGNNCGKIYIINLTNGILENECIVHEGPTTAIVKTNDNKTIISAGLDFNEFCVKIWKIK